MRQNTDINPAGFTTEEWASGHAWESYLASVEAKRDVWLANARRVDVSDAALHRLEHLPGPRRVLVLTEDWCGDAARSVPALAAALERAPQVEHRYLDSDAHPEVIARYLTHGGKAIPMAIVQDESGRELGAWGPRPAPLQALLRARKLELGAPTPDTQAAFYAPIMGWYGRDKGQTTIQELLMLLERGGEPR